MQVMMYNAGTMYNAGYNVQCRCQLLSTVRCTQSGYPLHPLYPLYPPCMQVPAKVDQLFVDWAVSYEQNYSSQGSVVSDVAESMVM
jgi:hypothetical protein